MFTAVIKQVFVTINWIFSNFLQIFNCSNEIWK